MARDAATARAEIARLKFQLARYRRAEFGRSSEKLARETEQLELAIEALEPTRPSGWRPPPPWRPPSPKASLKRKSQPAGHCPSTSSARR